MKAPVIGFSGRSEKPRRAATAGSTGRSCFAALLGEPEAAAPAGTAAACVAPAALSSLLALQDAAEAPSRRHAQQRAESLLDRLERLQDDLLLGRIPSDRLPQLAEALRQPHPGSGDPRLDDIIAAIELRVEVELAKWSMERPTPPRA